MRRKITFGKYEQGNGVEPIEWLVLDSNDKGMLLLSEYALDCKPYDEEDTEDLTWGGCSLREWLNSEFFKTAFTLAEQRRIVETTVLSGEDWIEGTETQDRIFLLSWHEVRQYLPAEEACCKPTAYALEQGIETDGKTKYCEWWIRNYYRFHGVAEHSYYDDGVRNGETYADHDRYGVRPALWVNLTIEEIEKIRKTAKAEGARIRKEAEEAEITREALMRAANGYYPAEKHIKMLKEELPEKKESFSRLGLFKAKEKKHLQEQIDEMERLLNKEMAEYEAKTNEIESLLKKWKRVSFGSYEQGNGVEPIQWRVLEVSDKGILLLSEYGLDCKKFHENDEHNVWKRSSLRKWLNQEFFAKAFNDVECALIAETRVEADNNYREDHENDTNDKIFLLSLPEAEKYLPIRQLSGCKPTAYALERGVDDDRVTGWATWWLRSAGMFKYYAAKVNQQDGFIDFMGYTVDTDYYCVRPALWIKLES